MLRLVLLAALLVVTGSRSEAVAASKNETANGFAMAYGFVVAQETTLEKIKQKYVQLATPAKLARLNFERAFPDILEKLDSALSAILKPADFKKLKDRLHQEMKDASREDFSLDDAETFLKDIEKRAAGDMPSPVLEHLLAAEYRTVPVEEFADGWVKKFKTEQGDKSQGIQLIMKVPRSWKAGDSDRPHVVQKWASTNYEVTEMLVLEIQDVQATDKEVNNFLKSGKYRAAVPKGTEVLNSGLFTIENRPGYSLETTYQNERVGMKFYQHGKSDNFFLNGKMISITCMVTGVENDRSAVNEAFGRIKPLCQQVLNSVILPQAN